MMPAVAAIPFMTFRLSILGKKFPFRALSHSQLVMVRFLCFSVYLGLLRHPPLPVCRLSIVFHLVMGM